MFITILKAISYIWPFLREIIIGKYSKDTRYRWVKIILLILLFISIIVNIWFSKIIFILSNEKINELNIIKKLEINLDLEKKKICHIVTINEYKDKKLIILDNIIKHK